MRDNHPMFVSVDGEYGSAVDLIQFTQGDLTDEEWDNVRALEGFERYRYIQALLDNEPAEVIAFILGEDY